MAGPTHLVVGLLKKPHGIKGEVLVFPATDEPEAVFRPGRILAVLDRDGRATGRELVVERGRPYQRSWLLRFDGIEDREAVEELREHLLGLAVEDARPLEEGEYYHHELVGLRVLTADGSLVGEVVDLFEAPQGVLLSVVGSGREHLIPFRSGVVVRVDRSAGHVVIAPPEGLLEL